MIPGFDLVQFSQSAGLLAAILAVATIIFCETGLFIGFFLPGDSIIFTLGFLLNGMGNNLGFGLNIHTVVIILFIAATLGYSVGYFFGYKIGPKIFKRPDSLLFKRENIEKAQAFYEKHGGKTIILARFIPIVRTFVPIVAGIGKMDFKLYTLYNLIGGAFWIAGISYGGYFLGAWFTSMGIDIEMVILPIAALIILVSVAPIAFSILKDEQRRTVIKEQIKIHAKKIVRRKDK